MRKTGNFFQQIDFDGTLLNAFLSEEIKILARGDWEIKLF